MNVKPFLVTIDVEGHPQKRDYASVDSLAQILESIDVTATLFVTPGVVENKTDTITKWINEGHEIGLHIHPERTPSGTSKWLTDYERAEKERMISWGLKEFESHLDWIPDVFRAGRWEYSDDLLEVLSEFDFQVDSSLRPDEWIPPYERRGVRELPLSVYTNLFVRRVLRDYQINSIPMTIDAFLKKRLLSAGYYTVAGRLILSQKPYFMIAFHDYDVRSRPLSKQIEQFISVFNQVTRTHTVSEL